MKPVWTQQEAIALCVAIHPLTEKYGCYVALTGGLLYKDGPRKDLDLVFYRIRQCEGIDKKGLFAALEELRIKVVKGFGFCHKSIDEFGRTIDLLFPEEDRFQTVIEYTQTTPSGKPIEAEEVDPEPDPKPEDELIQAMVKSQCSQGHEFTVDD